MQTQAHDAIETNDTAKAKELIPKLTKEDLDSLHVFAINCRSLLHMATLNNNIEVVGALLEVGANVNRATCKFDSGIPTEGGWTALDLAVVHGFSDLAELLKVRGGARGRPTLTRNDWN